MAVGWAFRYHMGSLAFGSFLLAVVTMIRVICEYLIYQYEKANVGMNENCVWKCMKCSIRCVTGCLDCCVKYINKNAYIQIALHNSNFCTAAKESFFLNLRNGGRFGAVSMIGAILTVLGKGSIVASCIFITIAVVDNEFPQVSQPWLPAIIIAFFAFLVSSMFLSIFQDAALTILHCFCLDEEQGGSR
jgi:choline transporter-like protein 2/4/5